MVAQQKQCEDFRLWEIGMSIDIFKDCTDQFIMK